MGKRLRILLLVEPSSSYGRGILRGIAKYAHSRTNWIFEFEHAASASDMLTWGVPDVEGVIVRAPDAALLSALRRRRIPVVQVSGDAVPPSAGSRDRGVLPRVTSDNEAVGRLAASHFVGRGFRRFAGCGLPERSFSAERIGAFAAAVRAAGFEYSEWRQPLKEWDHTPSRDRRLLLEPWVKSLLPATAVLACNDEVARHVLESCRGAGVRVPEDLSVLGVDNDEVLCDLSFPALSSIELGTDRVGYAAAGLLAKLIAGKPAGRDVVVFEPVGVVSRRSIAPAPVADELAQRALQFVNERAFDGIRVKDVVRHTGVSRRWLELCFRRHVGRSLSGQIRQLQIERAKQLLAETDQRMRDVASAAGFKDPKLLVAVFRREVGVTPSAWRGKFQLR